MLTSTETFPPNVHRELARLVACVPPAKLRRTVRALLLEYLSLRPENWPPELNEMPDELMCLFRLLDALGDMPNATPHIPSTNPTARTPTPHTHTPLSSGEAG